MLSQQKKCWRIIEFVHAAKQEETARALASDHAESEQKGNSLGEKGKRWLGSENV